MPDDLDFFDDDSLIPDWMQDSSPDEEPASDARPPSQSGSSLPPWEQRGGSPPPPPSGRTPAPPPWETFKGATAPPPSASGVVPPWGETLAPPPQEPPRSPIRRIAPSGEQPPVSQPAQPSAEDAAWLGSFGEAAHYDMRVPSGEEDDLDWLSAAEPAESPEPAVSDLEALIFDGSPEPADEDELETLFADEFPEPEPPAEPVIEEEEEEDLSWLDDDLGVLPVLASHEPEPPDDESLPDEFDEQDPEQAIPEWMDTGYDQEEPEEEEGEALPDWLQAELGEDEEPEELEEPEEVAPDWLSAPEEPPAAATPPRSPIRRITPAAEEPPRSPIRRITPAAEEPPEPDEGDMQAWLASVESAESSEEQPADMEGLTYEEWEQLQHKKEQEARKTDEERLLEEGPDWFSQIAPQEDVEPTPPSALSKDTGPEFVPDWFLGLEEQKEEEAPDWFKKLDFSADALTAPVSEPTPPESATEEPAAPDVPDWFTGAALPGFDDTDWDAAFGPPPEEEKAPPVPESPTPAEEEPPAWLLDSTWEMPAEPSVFAEEAPMSQDEFELPDFEAGAEGEAVPGEVPAADEEEALLEDEFELPDFEAGAEGEAVPGEVPAADEEEALLEDEFELPDFEAGAEGEAVPGEVPDWLSEAAPDDDELPLPDTGALLGFGDQDIEPGEIPDWLTAELDARAAPDEVPFPEIDLDETMPTEGLLDEAAFGEAQAESEDRESWMTGFVPGEGLRRSQHDAEEPEDFVERFEPLEPEVYETSRPAPVDDESPAWLREMADEGVLGEVSLADDVSGLPPEVEEAGEAIPGLSAEEAEMDWLSGISAEDIELEPEDAWAAEEMPPKPDKSIPELEPGTLHTAPLDSSAIDQLLGLYEQERKPVPQAEESEWAPEEAEALFEEIEAEEAKAEAPEEAAPPEVTGVPDLEWMPPAEGEEGEPVPDLEALLDEAALGDLFPPADEADLLREERAEPLPSVPEAPPRFRQGKPEPERAPEAPEEALPAIETQPEWIAEMRPSDLPVVVKAGGAETSITQKQVIELPERLRAFHEAAMRDARSLYETSAPPPPADSGPLAGIAGALPLADLVLETTARPVEGVVITPEQKDRLDRLQALLETVAAEEEELEEEKTQIEGLEPLELEGLEEGEQPAPEAAPKRVRRRRRFKLDRVIMMLGLLAALIGPFVTETLHLASDPPALEDERLAVGSVVDTLTTGQYVLFAFEYGPTAAGELDPLAEAVLRDVLAQGAVPLTISTDPAGAFHAQAVIDPLIDDTALLDAREQDEVALQAGEDYFLLRFLAGEAVGVRSLRSTYKDAQGNLEQHPAFKTDLRGDKTDLMVGSLGQDIALIVVIGAESNAVRTWVEQLNGMTIPKVALVTAAIEPLTVPYVNEDGYAGYLAGVRDTYSYNAARNTAVRTPYTMPADVPVDVPNPEESRWHSMALGAAMAALLITLGMVVNLLRKLTRRQRR
jgi:hypothetical protein